MRILPRALDDVIEAFRMLPGVGPRTAERYAYHLLKAGDNAAGRLAATLSSLNQGVRRCPVTYALIDADASISPLYDHPSRDKQQVAVVSEPFDIAAIEATGRYHGTYHVLGGLLSPIDDITPEQLRVTPLLERVRRDSVKEVILALNASVEGESTSFYLQKQLSQLPVRLTRLARGLPAGIDLEYTDQITLGRALDGRTPLNTV